MSDEKGFLERCCTNGIWNIEPSCSYIQTQDLPHCPDSFKESGDMCYLFTERSTFPPKCPFEDNLPFKQYESVLQNKKEPVWMPVQRNKSNGFGFFQWIEPSSLYRTDVEDNYYVTDSMLTKDCLLYYNSSYIMAVSCQEEHVALCAYRKLGYFSNYLCDNVTKCYQSDFSTQSKCFCQSGYSEDQPQYIKAEFLKLYQNNLYYSLTEGKENCSIGLFKSEEGKFMWVNSDLEIDYTYWSPDANFDQDNVFGVATPYGWILKNKEEPCVLYEVESKQNRPELNLTFDEVSNTFNIAIKNPYSLKWLDASNILLYCFTDATSLNLIYRYPILHIASPLSEATMILTFTPYRNGPGHYWCESFQYPDMEVIHSNTAFLRQRELFGPEFIAILKLTYIQGTNPLSKGIIEFLERVLYIKFGTVDHLNTSYTVRITKILDVYEETYEIIVNVHFTSVIQDPLPNIETEFVYVKNIIQSALTQLEEITIEMLDFLSPDFCFGDLTQQFGATLTWPTAELGTKVYPKEFCFKKDKTRYSRLCDGNFIDGGTWSYIEESCDVYMSSQVTNNLTALLDQEDVTTIMDQLWSISMEHSKFLAVDLYLVGSILGKLASEPAEHIRKINLNYFTDVISNLEEIDTDILKEAQIQMAATDTILYNINDILTKFAKDQYQVCFKIVRKNFLLIFSDLVESDLTGIMLRNTSDENQVELLYGDITIEDLNTDNMDCAVIFSEELKIKLEEYPSVFVSINLKSSLYNDELTTPKLLSTIINLITSDLAETLIAPISFIWKNNDSNPVEIRHCSSWNYGLANDSMNIQGFWKIHNDGIEFPSFFLCNYYTSKHLAMVIFDPPINDTTSGYVTDQLSNLLFLNNITEIVIKLSEISFQYQDFISEDVSLVGEIFKKISLESKLNLDYLSDVMNNLQKIDEDVLNQANVETNATNTILFNLEQIFANHEPKSAKIVKDKFILISSDVEESKMTGLTLIKDEADGSLVPILAIASTAKSGDIKFDNFVSSIFLTDYLIQEMIQERQTRIYIAIYSTNCLFSDKKPSSLHEIFSIFIPGFDKKYPPLSIVWKSNQSELNGNCANWNYDNGSDQGSWEITRASVYVEPLFICNYFQNGHFNLILSVNNTHEATITDLLSALLYLQNPSTIMEHFATISQNYEQFDIYEIWISSIILEKVSSSPDINLVHLAEVVSNLQKVDKEILEEAQNTKNSTNIILYQIDLILTNHEYRSPVAIIKDNFILAISDIKQTNYTGIIFEKRNNEITLKVLQGDVHLEQVKRNEFFESGAFLSPDLKQQMLNANITKVAVAIYLKKSFFNGNTSEPAGPIFGVLLPGFNENLLGKISLLYKVDPRVASLGNCVHWNFNGFNSIEGYWETNHDSEISDQFHLCDFWHTTHFALILLDKVNNSTRAENVTDKLTDILTSDKNASEIIIQLLNISMRYDEFDSYDIHLVGAILGRVSNESNIDLQALSKIVSNLHDVNRSILSESQWDNCATDVILYNIDKIIKNYRNPETKPTIILENNFALIISDSLNNLSGLVLQVDDTTITLTTLYGDVDLGDIKQYSNLVTSIILSRDLKKQLEKQSNMIFTIYPKDSLFNEMKPKPISINNIFGVILPLYDDYLGPLYIINNVTKRRSEDNCVFWEYNTENNVDGSWTRDDSGQKFTEELVLCEFWHTTHFGLLLVPEDHFEDSYHFLDWITTINCALSLIGLLGILLTAILFKQWRTNTGNQILINFVLAISLQIGTYYVSNIIKVNSDSVLMCTIGGVLLHYSMISQFCWMFVIAVLQFRRFVEVLGGPPKYVLFKACLCGWALPLLPVLCVLILDSQNYVNSKIGLCYPSGLGLYLGISLPIAIIVAINLVIFIYIICNVVHKKTECVDTVNDEVLFQWRLAILLFFLLGLTWTFGLLSELEFGVVFVYLFCFTATLQGFIMFLFFIVFNKNTRSLYYHAIKRCCFNSKYY